MQPVEIGWGNSATDSSLRGFQYGYGTSNNNGNVLSQTISAAGFTATQAYGYDGVNRLETSAEGTLWSRNHGYDQYGNNWVSAWSGVAPHAVLTPTSQSAYTAANNRLAGFNYDTGGNLTGANSVTYTYDGENRLAATSEIRGGEPYTTAYQYDGEGRRVKKTVGAINTVYVYDAMGQMIAEYTDAETEQTAATEYVLADHLGSTRAVLDTATNTLSCHDYLPFGEELTAGRESVTCYTTPDSVKQKFTGKERDSETGLDYFGARYFGSALTRFITPDAPLFDQHARNPQTWNLYSYARNNPLRFIDPNGESAIEWGECPGGPGSPVCAEAAKKKTDVVAVDPGHGDRPKGRKYLDPGAVDGKEYEKDYALTVANQVSASLEESGLNVVQTRTGDVENAGERLVWRLDIANQKGASVFVSIHMDAGPQGGSGMKVLYGTVQSMQLAENISGANTVMPNRGIEQRPNLRVLKYKGGPSALVEVGFINNPADRTIVAQKAKQIGKEIADGIRKSLAH